MSYEVLRKALQNTFDSVFAGKRFTICWHAGEPLAAGLSYFRDAAQVVTELNSEGRDVTLSIQTNGTLIDEDWAKLFRDFNFQVGLSLDGPKHVHDSYRKTRAGAGTFDSVVRGAEVLRQYSVPFHAIAVISRETLGLNPREFYTFFENIGASGLAFNIQELEGSNRIRCFGTDAHDDILKDFLRGLAEVWRSRNFSIRMRDFAYYFQLLRDKSFGRAGAHDASPFSIINVGVDGSFSTFSPELLTWKAGGADFSLGNVLTDSFDEAIYTEKFRNQWNEIQRGHDLCRAECEYFPVCGGGVPSNKYFELGSFAGTKTRSCATNVMAVSDTVLDLVERL